MKNLETFGQNKDPINTEHEERLEKVKDEFNAWLDKYSNHLVDSRGLKATEEGYQSPGEFKQDILGWIHGVLERPEMIELMEQVYKHRRWGDEDVHINAKIIYEPLLVTLNIDNHNGQGESVYGSTISAEGAGQVDFLLDEMREILSDPAFTLKS